MIGGEVTVDEKFAACDALRAQTVTRLKHMARDDADARRSSAIIDTARKHLGTVEEGSSWPKGWGDPDSRPIDDVRDAYEKIRASAKRGLPEPTKAKTVAQLDGHTMSAPVTIMAGDSLSLTLPTGEVLDFAYEDLYREVDRGVWWTKPYAERKDAGGVYVTLDTTAPGVVASGSSVSFGTMPGVTSGGSIYTTTGGPYTIGSGSTSPPYVSATSLALRAQIVYNGTLTLDLDEIIERIEVDSSLAHGSQVRLVMKDGWAAMIGRDGIGRRLLLFSDGLDVDSVEIVHDPEDYDPEEGI